MPGSRRSTLSPAAMRRAKASPQTSAGPVKVRVEGWAAAGPASGEGGGEGGERKGPGHDSSRPASAKAATARSSSSRVCVAEIWVRMRALPLGTTG